jgi:hypothetical protein
LKIVFNKSDNFICCSYLCKTLNDRINEGRNINKFFKQQSTAEIIRSVKNDASKLYYKLSKKDVKTDGDYTGYYINQDLFPLFISWLAPKKFI